MVSLPFQLDPGPNAAPTVADPGWTPLRVGLACAWLAALVALLAVGAGYFRLEELTRGYYTGVLRLLLLGSAGAIGAGLWLVL